MGKKIDRSLLQGESFELFSAAIKSPATEDPYERKLLGFLKRINLSPDGFVQFAKENPSAASPRTPHPFSHCSATVVEKRSSNYAPPAHNCIISI
jgi:hypothetical protein